MLIKFHENPSSGAELYHTDGRKDRRIVRHDEVILDFRSFANAPKTVKLYLGEVPRVHGG
jgi:hypothetical protein